VHQFYLGDVEDPTVYASFPLMEFFKTEKGQWCKQYGRDLNSKTSPTEFGYQITITGRFTEKVATEYYLRWG
jgi:hypothetical protein